MEGRYTPELEGQGAAAVEVSGTGMRTEFRTSVEEQTEAEEVERGEHDMATKKTHKYFVEWSAPDYRKSGSLFLMAQNKPDAIAKAKKRLGSRVKKYHLNHFDAWRVGGNRWR